MFQIDPLSRIPIYEQLIEQIEKFILSDIFQPDEQIPSVRTLSIEYSINTRTVLKAFSELDERGIIRPVPGKGYFVCSDAKEKLHQSNMKLFEALSQQIKSLAKAGISKEDIIKKVNSIYEDL